MALEALSEYAAKTMEKMGSIVVTVSTADDSFSYSQTIELTGDNFGLLQTVQIPTTTAIPDTVSVVARGTGGKCLVSATVSWYEAAPIVIEPPIVIVCHQYPGEFRRRRASDVVAPNPVYTTKVCASVAEGKEDTGMSVIQADFYSGFVLGEDIAEVQANNPNVKLVEDYGTGMAFYIDAITSDETCVSFKATRSHKVAEVKPIRVRAYDYYELEASADQLVAADPMINMDVFEDVAMLRDPSVTFAPRTQTYTSTTDPSAVLQSQEDGSGSLSGGAIAGIVVAAIVVVAIVVFAVVRNGGSSGTAIPSTAQMKRNDQVLTNTVYDERTAQQPQNVANSMA